MYPERRSQQCLGGPGVPAAPGCEGLDLDTDGDVDLIDFGQLQLFFTGSLPQQ